MTVDQPNVNANTSTHASVLVVLPTLYAALARQGMGVSVSESRS